jgi:sigma-B regulation protein RsbU (phosphoserine phosphatase)
MIANRELCKANEKSMFCSVFLARVQLRTGMLDFANAGHLPPYLLRAHGTVEAISSMPVMPVGAMPETVYTAGSIQLAPGDGLFIYSDGVTEATNTAGVQYGEAQLATDLQQWGRMHGRELLDGVLARVRAHCGDAPQTDDVTALMFRWRPSA